jgi:hypothetical protein
VLSIADAVGRMPEARLKPATGIVTARAGEENRPALEREDLGRGLLMNVTSVYGPLLLCAPRRLGADLALIGW